MDPVTLVVTAVALGASAGLKDTAAQAVKDAYAGLKRLLGARSVNIAGVERRPDSAAQRAALEETVADAGAADEEVVAAANAVTEAVAAHDAAAAPAIGIDLSDVRAAFLTVRRVHAKDSGLVIRHGEFDGGITVEDLQAGTDPTKR